jgi:hypothetical protein
VPIAIETVNLSLFWPAKEVAADIDTESTGGRATGDRGYEFGQLDTGALRSMVFSCCADEVGRDRSRRHPECARLDNRTAQSRRRVIKAVGERGARLEGDTSGLGAECSPSTYVERASQQMRRNGRLPHTNKRGNYRAPRRGESTHARQDLLGCIGAPHNFSVSREGGNRGRPEGQWRSGDEDVGHGPPAFLSSIRHLAAPLYKSTRGI